MNDGIRMQISAFVDDELPENEAELLIRRLSQDAELRQEVAEYLALGRLIRSEAGLSGADRLHERISAKVDERPANAEQSAVANGAARFARPMAGFAIAATVALAAIFALQQTNIVDDSVDDTSQARVDDEAQQGVPNLDAQLERQRLKFQRHAETSSRFGANRINSRVVDLRFSEEIDEDTVLLTLDHVQNDAPDGAAATVQP